jgi:cell division protein ZapA (FtsZ GTPase activity inhibitor)
MREISRSGGAVDSVRIAVLAALNIADACFHLRGAKQEVESAARQRAQKLASELARAIEE